ncbi:hypothetical protein H0H87_002517 [Tephrocybe sp. NHM501043]|nr:hypothetical protein H0H87_002517 [Tephrocybe sp. NHM501043]
MKPRQIFPTGVSSLDHALSDYPGLCPLICATHKSMGHNVHELDRMEWSGDLHFGKWVKLVLMERPWYGHYASFVSVRISSKGRDSSVFEDELLRIMQYAFPLLTCKYTMASMVSRSGLGYPNIENPSAKKLSDGLEVVLHIIKQTKSEREAVDLISLNFGPLISALEKTWTPPAL